MACKTTCAIVCISTSPIRCWFDDTQIYTVAIGTTGDIMRALGDQTVNMQAFVTVLKNLWSEVLNWIVKISIMACFGDIALTIRR
jgi:hypothetical protein